MQIRPIKSEQDYEAALKRIESLKGSDEEAAINELEVLSTLVDVYEQEFYLSPRQIQSKLYGSGWSRPD
jgi:HTH-type transcriptional regulator / antitoxin HigA